VQPNQLVSPSEAVTVKVLDVDAAKRRISLSLRQCSENPYEHFLTAHPIGTVLEKPVKFVADHGLIIALADDLEGRVAAADISWDKVADEALKDYKADDIVKVKVLDVDIDHDAIRLGIKQLSDDPFETSLGSIKAGDVVTCVVSHVMDNGIEVKVGEAAVVGFIRKSDLARDRSEQRADRFAIGEKVDALVTAIDQKARRFSLSIKAREIKEEKEVMAEYGSSDSGASLGDILGAAIDIDKMKSAAKEKDTEANAEEKPTKAVKKTTAKKAEAAVDTEEKSKKVAKKPAAKKTKKDAE